MRINPITVNPGITKMPMSRTQNQNYGHKIVKVDMSSEVTFKGKHGCAKLLGGAFGVLGTLGAIGGTIIMTGGVALPFVLGYGAISAGSGVVLGHIIDKGAKNSGNK